MSEHSLDETATEQDRTEEDADDEPEGDTADDERALFGERREETTLFVGSSLGLTRVDVAAAQVGQFSLVERCSVRALATDGDVLLVATDEKVSRKTADGLDGLGFGPADTVGVDDAWFYAADGDRVSRLDRSALAAGEDPDWGTVGSVADPRRFDGNLLAAAELVTVGDELESSGLDAVRDVSATGSLAATADGLFARTDGNWKQQLAGNATAVIAEDDRAHAIVDGHVYERADGSWQTVDIPGEAPIDLAYGQTLAVIDSAGSVHVAADPDLTHDGHGGWRSQAIGLRDVTGFVALD